jgi:hypothetical protein
MTCCALCQVGEVMPRVAYCMVQVVLQCMANGLSPHPAGAAPGSDSSRYHVIDINSFPVS